MPAAVIAGDQATPADVERIRSFERLEGLTVGGFVYDVRTGRLDRRISSQVGDYSYEGSSHQG